MASADLIEVIERRRRAQAARAAEADDRWRRFQIAARRRYAPLRRSLPAPLQQLLGRGKPPGRFVLLALSGLWLRDLASGLGSASGPAGGLWSYVRAGPDPGAQPRALFDQGWYLENQPDLAGSRWPPLAHYLVVGAASGQAPHPLFDPDLQPPAPKGRTPLHQWLAEGAAAGDPPHRLFDPPFYVGRCEEVADTGENPLVHYLRQGWREGLDPHPLFAGDWYLARNPEAAEAGVAPLLHYVVRGAAAGRDPHPLFSTAYYARQVGGGPPACALAHFLARGAREGRSPTPHFRPAYYLHRAGDDPAASANPLVHYMTIGAFDGLWPSPEFDEAGYFASYPEAVGSPLSAMDHWARAGAARPRPAASALPKGASLEALYARHRDAAWPDPEAYDLSAHARLRSAWRRLRRRSEQQGPAKGTGGALTSSPELEVVVVQPGAAIRSEGASHVLLVAPGTAAPPGWRASLAAELCDDALILPVGSATGARTAPDATLLPRRAAPPAAEAPFGALAAPRAGVVELGLDDSFETAVYALADLAFRLRTAGVRLRGAVTPLTGATPAATAIRDAQRLLEKHGEAIEALNRPPVVVFRRPAAPDWRALLTAGGARQPRLPWGGLEDPAAPGALARDEALADRYGLLFAHEVAGPEDVQRLTGATLPYVVAWTGSAAPDHFAAVAGLLRSPLAVRLEQRPVLVLPPEADAESWRRQARSAGLEPWLAARGGDADPREAGFDARIGLPHHMDEAAYVSVVRMALRREPAPWPQLPCVAAGRDTPAGRWRKASPGAFQAWLEAELDRVREEMEPDRRLVFMESWNGWAAGSAIRPDLRYGHGWLEAVANARDAELLAP